LTRSRPSILVLLSEVGTFGGIQMYNRLLLKALSEYSESSHIPLKALSFKDADWSDPDYFTGVVLGSSGSKGHFLRSAAMHLARRPALLVAGIVDFAPMVFAAHLTRTRVVTQVHGIEVWRRLPLYRRLGLKNSDLIWSVSQFTRDKLINVNGVPPDLVHVIHTAIDPSFWATAVNAQTRHEPEGSLNVLAVGRMAEWDAEKGIEKLLYAVGDAVRCGVSVTLTVIGDGVGRHGLQALAVDLGLGDSVEFLGWVEADELHRRLQKCTVFALPSSKEGLGIVFLEAMAYGKPVLAVSTGGVPEVVIGGETGILAHADDQRSVTDGLMTLLTDAPLRERMGANALARARTEFNFSRFASALRRDCDGLLGSNV
jgi:phosphatidyl-myo-inositol dimannoside synthase